MDSPSQRQEAWHDRFGHLPPFYSPSHTALPFPFPRLPALSPRLINRWQEPRLPFWVLYVLHRG